jgi:hypothetical protein
MPAVNIFCIFHYCPIGGAAGQSKAAFTSNSSEEDGAYQLLREPEQSAASGAPLAQEVIELALARTTRCSASSMLLLRTEFGRILARSAPDPSSCPAGTRDNCDFLAVPPA